MREKIIIILSAILIVLVSISLILFANDNKDNYKYDESIISNRFEYEQAVTNESIENIYYYSDSYFKEDSDKENEHLRTFSLSLALAFNPTYRKETINYNLNSILDELNFLDVMYYDLDQFSKDSIGTSIAHKKLNDKYELVVIVLRGSGYSDEWKSNFDSGESGNIKGFDEASLTVLSRLEDYLEKNKIKDYKLLVTGYSRAGAISGLVGVHINNNLGKYNIDEDHLFVYSFESPRYSSENEIYDNIHNVINKNDIVTYVYPESWKIYHSGKEEDITTPKSIIKEKYLDLFSSEKIKELEDIDKQRFIQKFINILPKERDKYNEISDSIISIYELLNNKNSQEKERIISFIKNLNIDFNLDSSITLLSLINSDDKDTCKKAFNSLMLNYDKEYSKIKNSLNENEYKKLKEDIFDIYMFLQPTIRNEYKSNYKFSNILTFVYNIDELFKEHYFSVNLEQVQLKDSYYKNA